MSDKKQKKISNSSSKHKPKKRKSSDRDPKLSDGNIWSYFWNSSIVSSDGSKKAGPVDSENPSFGSGFYFG